MLLMSFDMLGGRLSHVPEVSSGILSSYKASLYAQMIRINWLILCPTSQSIVPLLGLAINGVQRGKEGY